MTITASVNLELRHQPPHIAADPDLPPTSTPWWSTLDAFVAVLVAGFSGGFCAALLMTGQVFSGDQRSLSSTGLAAVLLVWQIALAGWCLHVSRWKGFGAGRDFGFGVTRRDVMTGLVAGAGLTAVILGILTATSQLESARFALEELRSGVPIVLIVATAVIGAPVAEEFLFRGLLLRSLLQRHSPFAALVVSSGFFALAHATPWTPLTSLWPAAVAGVALGTLTLRTKRLLPAIITHAVYNGAVLIFFAT